MSLCCPNTKDTQKQPEWPQMVEPEVVRGRKGCANDEIRATVAMAASPVEHRNEPWQRVPISGKAGCLSQQMKGQGETTVAPWQCLGLQTVFLSILVLNGSPNSEPERPAFGILLCLFPPKE